jgi:hypothetical protein
MPAPTILRSLLRFAALAAGIISTPPLHSDVLINEFVAASSERRLSWNGSGAGRVGSGYSWTELEFDAASWSNGLLPAGYAIAGLSTDLTSQMKGKTPSLYLRKEFQATSEQSTSSGALVLSMQYNDGFVAYLNGREVARANCGPTNHFVFAAEPACNVSTTSNVVEFALGTAAGRLVSGRNILALQAHNAEQPSTASDQGRILQHLPTPEFRVNAALRAVADTNAPAADFVSLGAEGGTWKYFVGRAEPSGGLVDMGLLTRVFTPPAGEEDDYDQPSAFSDWVELLNTGPADVNLAGWSLTDDPEAPAKWRFPTNTSLAAGGFLLVLCDNRDEANPPAGPATRLHTNFKLNDEGGHLLLFDRLGKYMDGLTAGYPSQVSSCSFGRTPEDPTAFGFLALASPGTTNVGPSYAGRLEPVEFQTTQGTNLPGGLYPASSLTLCLSHPTPGATIRYTLNGSEPTEGSGLTYAGPLVLTQANDKTGTVVRARATLPGWVPSKVKTHTYVLRQAAGLTNLPMLALTADPGRDWYRPDGLLAIVRGFYVDVGSGSIWQANGPSSYNWVLGNGASSERETHLEYYFPPGRYPTNQEPWRGDIGLRVSASGYSRPRMRLSGAAANSPWAPGDFTEKPSFNLYFNGDFGPGKLDYGLFTDYSVREFSHLRLRAGKNDMTNPFITDELVRRLWIDMKQAGARGLFCSMYVNGVYKGVFNLCERFRQEFFQAHFRSQASWDVDYSWTWVDGNNTAFNQLLTALDQNLTNLSNWHAVTNRLEIDNAADYFLLNIYCAMWDWPGNNYAFARERSNGPLSRFRFAVWDAEGAFNSIGYGHPVSYNTITSDLIVPSGHPNYLMEVARIFRRLATAPEFRLQFADRVNLRFFNGGVLDDRDPDGAGPGQSRFALELGELNREMGGPVKYNSGSTLNLASFNSWANSVSGRRSYLLGTATGRRMLRDAGFWPLTEPPVFSQHGGTVPPGYGLSMTSAVATVGQTATIYYTTNGSDPRIEGGGLNPLAWTYANAITLDQVCTVKARARNTTTSEWSPLTEATFAPASIPGAASNLVIAEIMYHPPQASASERAAGFDNADDFEFVRLINIAATPIDLAGVRFDLGITFDFTSGALRYLNPGTSVLAVANLTAFQLRYGHGADATIAGMYSGNLSNGGERLRLIDAGGLTLRDLTFSDLPPWPIGPDGDGPSLILIDPAANPDHASPANWTASAIPGGLPMGVPPVQSYETWRALYWSPTTATNDALSGPAADFDGDGLANFLEYAFGQDPRQPSPAPSLIGRIETIYYDSHLTLSLRVAAGAVNSTRTWEISDNLVDWSDSDTALQLLSSQLNPDGTTLLKYFETNSVASAPARFFRLRVSGP